MKTRKKSKIVLLIIMAAAVALLIYLLARPKASGDPVQDFVKENNYPFNGYYNAAAKEYTEQELAELLSKHESISKYAENISITIEPNNKIGVSATLKDVSELVSGNQKLWAAGLNNQQVSAVISLVSTQDDTTALKLTEIKIGTLSLDPSLVEPLIANSRIQQQLAALPYSGICTTDGKIAVAGDFPMLTTE